MSIRYFTKMPNEIIEKIIECDFSKRQLKILLQITRLTFGCHIRVMAFKVSDFSWCGIGKGVAKTELRKLAAARVIIIDFENGAVAINSEVGEWELKINPHDLRNELLSKQLRAKLVLSMFSPKGLYKIKSDEVLKEILKKININKLYLKEAREIARKYTLKPSDLAKKFRVDHNE